MTDTRGAEHRFRPPAGSSPDIERRGVGADRVIFASDESWSDFWGEYWKIEGVPVSSELKDRIFHRNFEDLYGHKW